MSIDAILETYEDNFSKTYLYKKTKKFSKRIQNQFKTLAEEKIILISNNANSINTQDLINILNETKEDLIAINGLKSYSNEELNLIINDVENVEEFKKNYLKKENHDFEIERITNELFDQRNSEYMSPTFAYDAYSNTIEINNNLFLGKKYSKELLKKQEKVLLKAYEKSNGVSKILILDELKNFLSDEKEYKLKPERGMLESLVLLDTYNTFLKTNYLQRNNELQDLVKNVHGFYKFYSEDRTITKYVIKVMDTVDKTHYTNYLDQFKAEKPQSKTMS